MDATNIHLQKIFNNSVIFYEKIFFTKACSVNITAVLKNRKPQVF